MSIEITLYPPRAKRDELVAFLKGRGFQPCGHLWQWPKGTVNLHWFGTEEFESFDGVEASVFPPAAEERAQYVEGCEWAIHTRVRVAGSAGDHQQQNETIRAARKKFGGDFYNDWHGRNRYTPRDPIERTPTARGLYVVYERTRQNLEAVKYALPPPMEIVGVKGPLPDHIAQLDPARILYNGLVPFVVAALEHFFSQAFKILLRYDTVARQRLLTQTARKVEFVDAIALYDKRQTIEDIVADWYSFQSLDSIHKAFKDWFEIDFWKLIRQRRRIGTRVDWLERRFKALIEFRHGVVHRFEVDRMLDKTGLEELLALSVLLMNAFIDHIETSRGEEISDLIDYPRKRHRRS